MTPGLARSPVMDTTLGYLSFSWEKRAEATMEAPLISEQGQTVSNFATAWDEERPY
jgi:hypothetical protein